MDLTKTKLSLEWKGETSRYVSCVRRGGLASVFMKLKWMLEKVIHEDSTRYIVESLRGGMNKRKTASVYTPALAAPQVKSSGVTPSSRGKQ